MRVFLFFICLIIISPFKSASAQPYHITIGESRGIPALSIYDVKQDNQGFIWLATEAGLYKYDGFIFKPYKSRQQTSMAGSHIQIDKLGRVWYQNFDGYCYYVVNDSLQQLDQTTPFYSQFGLNSKYIFTCQNDGICVYDLRTLNVIKRLFISNFKHDLKNTSVVNDTFYFILNKKLGFIDQNLNVSFHNETLPAGFSIPIFAKTTSRLILFSREQSNYYLELSNKNTLIKHQIKNVTGTILVTEWVDGQVWFCTTNGVFKNLKSNESVHWFPNQYISGILKDNQENIWVTTLYNGIYLVPFEGRRFVPLAVNKAKMVYKKQKQSFVFTENEVITYNGTFQIQQKQSVNEKLSKIYYAFLDTTKMRYFTSSEGMQTGIIGKHNSKRTYSFALKKAAILNSNYYVLATNGNLILYLRDRIVNQHDRWSRYFEPNQNYGILNQGYRFRTLAVLDSNHIYYSCNNGTFLTSPETTKEVLYAGKKLFLQHLESANGNSIGLTASGQLFRLKGATAYLDTGLIRQSGIQNFTNLKHYGEFFLLSGENKICVVSNITMDNVVSNPNSFIQNSDIKDIIFQNDSLFCLLNNGIALIPLFSDNQSKQPPFIINQMIVNREPINNKHNLLKYNQNNIQILFSVLDYTGLSNYSLNYKVNEEDWQSIDPTTRSILFASLSPGKYTIQFKLNGLVLKNQLVSFHIQEPIWLRWWFILACCIILLSVVYAYYRWQIQLVMKKNMLQTEKLTLEAELNKSILTAIKSQMNPHFFYNALNTIQAFIYTDDKKNASHFLAKLSKLTRNILLMSEKEQIRLSEEIESLTLYLELEKMRFDDTFNYTLRIGPNLAIDDIKIPPMLIQPYVENAIKHGLLHLQSDKNLVLQFSRLEPNILRVEIDDNGIGRKKSAELNAIRKNKHQSFSTQANAKRLEILNKAQGNAPVGVLIIDKLNSNNMAVGTTVVLDIPIK